ncbi:hypothetical protein E2C01_053023 [Portunus trituberculatus]|uniref:Uncharacterized protein n=1 Tax=Portunus trituberculatus TaxID=210409 RepID=A0A5B7GPQ0_PORTR|nr:hypothetical protein [Portunus trituberculatus]
MESSTKERPLTSRKMAYHPPHPLPLHRTLVQPFDRLYLHARAQQPWVISALCCNFHQIEALACNSQLGKLSGIGSEPVQVPPALSGRLMMGRPRCLPVRPSAISFLPLPNLSLSPLTCCLLLHLLASQHHDIVSGPSSSSPDFITLSRVVVIGVQTDCSKSEKIASVRAGQVLYLGNERY